MYHVSAQGVDERMINVHYYYYYLAESLIRAAAWSSGERVRNQSVRVLFLFMSGC